MESAETSELKSDSNANQCLALCLVDTESFPLNAFNPTQNLHSLRRSPRFTKTFSGTPKSVKSKLRMVPVDGLRRSPRFSPPPASESTKSESLKRKRVVENGTSSRRSPRFSGAHKGECGMDVGGSDKCRKCKREILALRENGEELCLHVNCLNNKIQNGSLVLSPLLLGTESGSSKSALPVILPGVSEYNKNCSSPSVSLKSCDCRRITPREMDGEKLWNKDDETSYDSRVSGENQLRRSPRFTMAAEIGDTKESLKKSAARHSDQKKLGRSPRQLFLSNGAETESKSLIRLCTPPDERPSKKAKNHSSYSDVVKSDEKFSLQFPSATNSCIDIEDDEMKNALIELPDSVEKQSSKILVEECSHEKTRQSISGKKQKKKSVCCLVGDPVPDDEAQERWCWRYEMKNQKTNRRRQKPIDDDDEDKIVWNVECHYTQADIEGSIFKLGDCAYIKGEGKEKHIGRIVEFFRTTDQGDYFRVQWFYRAEDTVMKEAAAHHNKKRLFYSTVMNDNPIDCIISKVNVVQKSPKIKLKPHSHRSYDFYFDMEYCVDYSTFRTLSTDSSFDHSSLPEVVEAISATSNNNSMESMAISESYKTKLALLDIFSGCGGMSTGLCLGAKVSCVDLVTRWALDSDKSACDSLKLNHPEAHVRNEAAEDFLALLKEWEKLCKLYAVNEVDSSYYSKSMPSIAGQESEDSESDDDVEPDEFEVSRIVDICYGDPAKTGKHALNFKVHWKGYSTSDDTWEPADGLSNCQECIRDFVRNGFESKILPLPGDVDVICGGPPCQGISGYNRFRNVDSPLADERNRQIIVFMDIVQYLKPKFVLMENVLDILRFDKASLARYALSRLVGMKYQARLGTMAAGCYGLPQFRMRVFLWGAHPNEKLPQFPLPTHDVIIRYWPPPEFERNTVAYDEDQAHKLRELEKATVLQDAIFDLPAVTSHEDREEMIYDKHPETVFQTFIRATKYEMTGSMLNGITRMNNILYDHRPYTLTEEDYARVCRIPKRKGANFRDLPGVIVGSDNIVRRDPTVEQEMLPSGKPLVPDFAFTFEGGKSKRPYARLWWDETVSTVVTYPDLHSMAIVHPEQDRVLTVRECARLQGFPDYYRFCGTVKQRYRQIGNAVAVPVGRALGYALGMAFQKLAGEEPLMTLPPKFSHSTNLELAKSLFEKND